MPKLTKTAALAKLSKLLGSRFAYRLNPRAVAPADRPTSDDVAAAHKASEDAEKARIQRELWLKANDPEYQRLLAAHKAARALHLDLWAKLTTKAITVGTNSTFAFSIEAEGDTWDEVVAEVEADRAKK